MPILPKDTLRFKGGGRVHLDRRDKTYNSPEDIGAAGRPSFDTAELFQREEQERYALYLRTLSRMLAEKDHDINAEHLFANPVDKLRSFGSQAHLIKINFSKMLRESGEKFQFGPNESTTHYKSYYNFMKKRFRPDESLAYCSVHGFDIGAIERLEKNGASENSFQKFGQDFLVLADVAEHGYLHNLIDFRHQVTGDIVDFALTGKDAAPGLKEKKLGMTTGSTHEDLTLSLHAQVLHEVFDETKTPGGARRKQQILTYAAQAFTELSGMVKEVENHHSRHPLSDRQQHEINEAITYFAELTAHRLFRIISPTDEALQQTTGIGVSVEQAAANLPIITPHNLLRRHQIETPPTGIKQLELNCSERLGETYRAIHTIDSFPLEIKQNISGYQAGQIIEPNALEAVSLLAKAAAMKTQDPAAYMKDSAEAAGKTRNALALRETARQLAAEGKDDKDGNRFQALLLEAELRSHPLPSARSK